MLITISLIAGKGLSGLPISSPNINPQSYISQLEHFEFLRILSKVPSGLGESGYCCLRDAFQTSELTGIDIKSSVLEAMCTYSFEDSVRRRDEISYQRNLLYHFLLRKDPNLVYLKSFMTNKTISYGNKIWVKERNIKIEAEFVSWLEKSADLNIKDASLVVHSLATHDIRTRRDLAKKLINENISFLYHIDLRPSVSKSIIESLKKNDYIQEGRLWGYRKGKKLLKENGFCWLCVGQV